MSDVFARVPHNQSVPLADYNAVRADTALTDGVHAFAGADEATDILASLDELGRAAGSAEAQEHARLANSYPPMHRPIDRFGHRVDDVEFHPSWHWLMERGVKFGMAGAAWGERAVSDPHAHLRRAAGFITWSGLEQGHVCPLTMTNAAIPALAVDDTLSARYAPGLASLIYDFGAQPASDKAGLLAGMGMTEKQGGSDVRSNVTVAMPLDDAGSEYVLRGHKWFTSAPTNDIFLVLAQAPGGLSCFVVPRVMDDGTRNGISIVRLKDKLGNRSNASSELEFHDAYAVLLGEEGAGVRTIIEMVSATRLDCVLGSAGLMRRMVAEASWYASHREAFGGSLLSKPAMSNVLADLALESEAATALGLRLAAGVDTLTRNHASTGADTDIELERAFRRVALPLAKFWVCKRTPMVAAESLECLGGNGYVEESGMPTLYREAPLNSIWEGSGNVNALDVLRALAKSPASYEALKFELNRTSGFDASLDVATKQVLADVESLDPEDAEFAARDITSRLAAALQASLLLRTAPEEVADAFIASRIQGRWGGVFGTLEVGTPTSVIAERALPTLR